MVNGSVLHQFGMNSTNLTSYALLGALVLLLGMIGIWHIAYNWESRLPENMVVETLDADIEIRWNAYNTAEIRAQSLSDGLFGLGYVQGQLNGWTIALWRQAALGKLTDWYGSEMVEADRLVRQLGFSDIAQRSLVELNEDHVALMKAFGQGIEHAWNESDQMHEFFLQDIQPDPWETWHSLAIELLIAWLSSPVNVICDLGHSICSGAHLLQSVLHISGLEHSSAWVMSSTRGPLFYQRHVLGRSVLPAYQEVTLDVANDLHLQGASLLGTPYFISGITNTHGWAILLNSPKSLKASHSDSTTMYRLNFPDREELVTYWRTDSTFSTPESELELYWNGFSTDRDSIAWFSLFHHEPTSFEIWRGDGIFVPKDTSLFSLGAPEFGATPRQIPRLIPQTSWSILGMPEWIHTNSRGGLLVSNDSLAMHAATFLDSIDIDLFDPLVWITNTHSISASMTLPPILDSLEFPEPLSEKVLIALSYLRNWNHRFEEQSIGATIYNEWMNVEETKSVTGLYKAVDDLSVRFGTDVSQWRWERVYADTTYFTYRKPTDSKILAPLISPMIGHESTMIWGGHPAVHSPVTWESWAWIAQDNSFFVRRRDLNLRQPLGRYISDRRGNAVFQLPTSHLKSSSFTPIEDD